MQVTGRTTPKQPAHVFFKLGTAELPYRLCKFIEVMHIQHLSHTISSWWWPCTCNVACNHVASLSSCPLSLFTSCYLLNLLQIVQGFTSSP